MERSAELTETSLPVESRPVRWDGRRIARRPVEPGGLVVAIEPGSPAAALPISPGDRVLAIDGQELRDVLDLQFAAAEDEIAIAVARSGHVRTIRARGEDAVGLRFREPTFDGITWCNNKCPFCFVKMNPGGGRAALYVKDDDYRYSAMYGNFVTLTNLTESDWRRIAEQRLSPLYVSVHVVDPALRRVMLGNPGAPDILPQLDRLAALGISYHAQAVLCPGVNDGAALDDTIEALAARHPAALSLSLVPVGLTSVGRHPPSLRRHRPDEARAVVRRASVYRSRFRRDLGCTFLFPSDELYLIGGCPLPPGHHYDGYAQYQNGVGMVRTLLDEWRGLRRAIGRRRARRGVVAVTGRLAEPILASILREIGEQTGGDMRLRAVDNRYFGSIVNVAGLLTGRDIVEALRADPPPLPDLVTLPRSTLDAPGERFLDSLTPADVTRALGRPIAFVESLGDLLRAAAGDDGGLLTCAA